MSKIDIKEKRILFFSPAFFNYENMIADKMRQLGANVDVYDVRSVSGAFQRALLKITPNLFKNRSQKYYRRIIEEKKNIDYDYILIVKCDMTPISILEEFRKVFPNAKLCLYLWDSVENIPGIVKKFHYFDTIHSFDLNDCEKYHDIKFRPLFFGDQYRSVNNIDNYFYDISFLGTIHSDRYAVIKQVQRIATENGLRCFWFLYLQSKFIYKFYKITNYSFRGTKELDFSYDKMTSSEIAEIINNSKVILDIQHPKQTGLTMRTIEMIGMNKKLITTNNSIDKYDFYDPNNIAIINRNNVEIPDNFFETNYEPIPRNIYEKYSLKEWIYEVLN